VTSVRAAALGAKQRRIIDDADRFCYLVVDAGVFR
jgi:hypothetical protein